MRFWEYFNSFGKIENTQSVNTFTKVTGFLGKCFVWNEILKKIIYTFPRNNPISYNVALAYSRGSWYRQTWIHCLKKRPQFLRRFFKKYQKNWSILFISSWNRTWSHGLSIYQLETHIFIIILFCGCSSDWGGKGR